MARCAARGAGPERPADQSTSFPNLPSSSGSNRRYRNCRRKRHRTVSRWCSGASSAYSRGRSTRSRCSSTICNGWMRQRSSSSSIWSRTRRCGICCWSAPTGTTRSAPRTRLCGRSRRSARPDARVQEIVLAPLGINDIGQLVADAMHCGPERALPLAAAGAREDRRQSVLRDPVFHGAG